MTLNAVLAVACTRRLANYTFLGTGNIVSVGRISLATDITNSCSLTVFKSKLKTYIFRQTFNRSN